MRLWLSLLLAGVVFLHSAQAIAEKNAEKDDEKPALESGARTKAEAAKIRLLDRVTVTGSPAHVGEIPGSVYRLDTKELRQQNQAFDDIHRVLVRIPGVNIQEEEGYGLRPNIGMRGTGSERSANITLMEDGVLAAPAPYAAPAAYYFPYVGRMEGVEVRKGSSQIKYGPLTNGGALNLQSTSVPEQFRTYVRAAAGQDNTRKIYANYGDSWKRLGWSLETYQMTTDGFKQLDTGGNTGFDIQDYVGKVRLRSGDDATVYQEFTIKGGYNEQTSNETYLGLTDADFKVNPFRRYAASQNDQMNTEHRQVQGRYFVMPNDRVDITATVYRNDFARNWYKLDRVNGEPIANILEDPVAYQNEYRIITGQMASNDDALALKNNNREYYSQGIDGIAGWRSGLGSSSHNMEFGARYHEDEEDRFQWSDGYRMEVGGAMVLTTAGVPGLSGGGNNRVNSAKAVALYAKDDIAWRRWILTPGVRYEYIDMKREQYPAGDPERQSAPSVTTTNTTAVLPGLGAHYQITSAWGTFAGVHRGFAPPGPGATDETLPEKSVNYEFGTRYNIARAGVQVLGFFNDYENLLGRDTFASGGTGSGDLYNGGAAEIYGVEAELHGNLVDNLARSFSVPFTFAYTFTHTEFKTSFVSSYPPWGDVQAGDELPYVPRHQFTGSVGYERKRILFGLSGNYMSEMRTEAGQGPIPPRQSTDARIVFDVTGELALAQSTRLFASMQNVTDEVYNVARRPAGVRPGLPRRVIAGIKLSL